MRHSLPMETTLSRREREKQMRRQEMLQAAKAVFAEKGYTHATLEEIAQRAEFGKGTLYNYFGSKEDILFAIFDELYDDICQHIETSFSVEETETRSIRDIFRDFFESTFSFFLERNEVYLLMMKVAHRMLFSEDPEKAQYFQRQGRRLVDALNKHFEAAIASGKLRNLPSRSVTHLVIGNVNGFLMHLSLKDLKEQNEPCRPSAAISPKEAANFLTTVLFDGLLVKSERH